MAGFVVTPENTLNIQHRRVLNAYFAERKKDVIEYETTQDTYTVKKGDYLSKIAQKKNTTVAKIKQDNNLTSDNIKIGDTLTISTEKEKGRQVSFKQIHEASLGDEVYVIVKTLNLQDQTIWLNVKQGQTEQPDVEFESQGLILQHDKGENTRAEAVVGAFAKDEQITNKDDFKDWAIFKFILGSKDTKREQDVLEKLTDKKAYVCLLIDAHSPNNIEVGYNGKNEDENGELDQSSSPNQWLDKDDEWFQLKPKSPIIVLDPGHGVKGGNVGAQARKYKYKLKGDNGKVKTDKNKHELTDIKDIMSLPQYVIDNPEKWIVGDNESSNHKYDNDRTEYALTYDVALKMSEILKEKGYNNVFLTRTSRNITKVTGHNLAYRIDIANNKNADYFISIHADGSKNFSSGAHAIYSSTDNIEDSKRISKDIMKYYNVVEVEADSPKKDIRGLRVLRTTNKTKRKTLVELGFLTCPSDAKKMFSNINLIAEQLTKGLIDNIKNDF